jgi:hypothetical protein
MVRFFESESLMSEARTAFGAIKIIATIIKHRFKKRISKYYIFIKVIRVRAFRKFM